MAIDNISHIPGANRRDTATGRDPRVADNAPRDPSRATAAEQEEVALSDRANRLNALADRIKATPAFDEARINDIRQRIENGEYPIDANRLAERFIELERTLNA